MIFCIPKNQVDLFLNKLKTGEINPEKLTEMTSEERNTYFSSFLGATNASKVNALFESKLLLKNQQQGIINWAKQVTGIKPQAKRDLLSRVEKMTSILQPKDLDSFLGDLVQQRLGFGVTMEEAGKITDLAKSVADKKALIAEDSPIRSTERMDYGTALVMFKDYVSKLKEGTKAQNIVEIISGTMKSLVASMDNSFFGRQGFKTLVEKPDIWWKAFGDSWQDMGKELKGIDAMSPIKADVWSRPNAINGKYSAQKLDIGIESEEAFPSQLPEKIPGVRRAFKASETAYNGAALRLRADLADLWFAEAEKNGVNVKDPETNIGLVINSITGRGKVTLTPGQSKFINASLFSIKYLKSTIDTLTAPIKTIPDIVRKAQGKEKTSGAWARKKWAQDTLKTLGVIGTILTIAKILDPESVELDPRSSKFGKIWVGKNHTIPVDITLSMGSIFTLASRLVPTLHNGKLGRWVKNSKGQYSDWSKGGYGKSVGLDFIVNFLTGKASPFAGAILNDLKARNYQGEKPTLVNTTLGVIAPISVSNAIDLGKNPEEADALLQILLNALNFIGFNVNPPSRKRR